MKLLLSVGKLAAIDSWKWGNQFVQIPDVHSLGGKQSWNKIRLTNCNHEFYNENESWSNNI